MRVRGLKLNMRLKLRKENKVAPHAGAWIETKISKASIKFAGSRPMRVRGLKLVYTNQLCIRIPVAPHAGAWIETHVKQYSV